MFMQPSSGIISVRLIVRRRASATHVLRSLNVGFNVATSRSRLEVVPSPENTRNTLSVSRLRFNGVALDHRISNRWLRCGSWPIAFQARDQFCKRCETQWNAVKHMRVRFGVLERGRKKNNNNNKNDCKTFWRIRREDYRNRSLVFNGFVRLNGAREENMTVDLLVSEFQSRHRFLGKWSRLEKKMIVFEIVFGFLDSCASRVCLTMVSLVAGWCPRILR